MEIKNTVIWPRLQMSTELKLALALCLFTFAGWVWFNFFAQVRTQRIAHVQFVTLTAPVVPVNANAAEADERVAPIGAVPVTTPQRSGKVEIAPLPFLVTQPPPSSADQDVVEDRPQGKRATINPFSPLFEFEQAPPPVTSTAPTRSQPARVITATPPRRVVQPVTPSRTPVDVAAPAPRPVAPPPRAIQVRRALPAPTKSLPNQTLALAPQLLQSPTRMPVPVVQVAPTPTPAPAPAPPPRVVEAPAHLAQLAAVRMPTTLSSQSQRTASQAIAASHTSSTHSAKSKARQLASQVANAPAGTQQSSAQSGSVGHAEAPGLINLATTRSRSYETAALTNVEDLGEDFSDFQGFEELGTDVAHEPASEPPSNTHTVAAAPPQTSVAAPPTVVGTPPTIADDPHTVADTPREVDDSIIAAAVPGVTPLSGYVRDTNLIFTGAVLGPVSMGIFKTRQHSFTVPLGKAIPDTDIVLTNLKSTEAELAQGPDTHVLYIEIGR